MSDFWLIRHGSTDTLHERIAGWSTGVRLNQRGQSEVLALSTRIDGCGAQGVYTSPLERARETAEPLADVLKCPLIQQDELGELQFGSWTNQRFDELDADPHWRRFNQFRSGSRLPGGDSFLSVQARAVNILLDLRARHPEERILIVSHGDVIKAVLMHFLGIPIDLCHRLTIAPTSISQIELHTDYVCIPRINDTSHIERPGCCSQSLSDKR
jgi:broad specificity phosphatase PhoE